MRVWATPVMSRLLSGLVISLVTMGEVIALVEPACQRSDGEVVLVRVEGRLGDGNGPRGGGRERESLEGVCSV